MKVGFVSADWSDIEDPETGHPTPGGAGWYRMGLPSKYLARNGVDTVLGELVSVDKRGDSTGLWIHDFDGFKHKDCDVIVIQRWMDNKAERAINMARAAGQIVVNDIDDWYWGLDRRNQAYAATDPKTHPNCNRELYKDAMAASDMITCSTPFLLNKMREMFPDVPSVLVRNAIDLERWEFSEPPQTTIPTVGWVGSTLHRSGDLETLRGILGPFLDRTKGPFMHAGKWETAEHAGELALVPEDKWLSRPLVGVLEYTGHFEGIDIGLVPLSEQEFNWAKSAIKGMEYAAAGVPFVAQASPEYVWLRETHGIGMTAKKPKQWRACLEKLLDPDERIRQARESRESVAALDFAIKWKDWLEVYESLL